MNITKWFIKSEEIFSIKNLYLLNITTDIMNEIETDKYNNYWKYRSFEEIRETLFKKYRISTKSFVVLYTKNKLMIAARFAWLLYWIGYEQIRILIGDIDSFISTNNNTNNGFSELIHFPTIPLRSKVRLICNDLFKEFSCSTTKFIDVRTYEEYSGQITGYPYVYQAGRIPNFQYDQLDGIYGDINGDITWNELEYYLKLMSDIHLHDKSIKRIVYMCGTGWRASLAAIFAEELNLAEIITVLDSGWFEWSERFIE